MKRRSLLLGSAAALAGLASRSAPAAPVGLRGAASGGAYWVSSDGRPVLAYRREPVSGPPGTPPLFARNAYIHPLYAPSGALVTDDFPADHLHQRGVFLAWTKTRVRTPEGELHPDFWNLGDGTGRIRCVSLRTRRGAGALVLTATHAWEARQGQAWREVLRETWSVTVRPPTGDRAERSAYYAIDLTSRQTPRLTLELPEYRYGGMCVRGSTAWAPESSGFRLLTSEGKDFGSAEGTRARWVDMSGPVAGTVAGVALLEHPANPGAPNRLRVPPDFPYYVFSPPKSGDVVLPAGRRQTFRYRLVVHDGPAAPGELESLWRSFAG